MAIFAQVINNVPSGIHRDFATAPSSTELESWLPVVIGGRATEFDPVTERIQPQRTIQEGNVVYEEVIVNLPLSQVKENKLKSLQSDYEQLLRVGYIVPGNGYSLALDKEDRNAFTGLYALLKDAIASGSITVDSPVVIADVQQKTHTVTVGQLFSILQGYGLFYQQLWSRIALANNAIQNAETVEDVVSVTL
jgi:hypothetical protein